MKIKDNLLKNTGIIAIGRCSTQILMFLLLPLYTSILTTKEYGQYDLLNTVSIFLIPFVTLLMEEAMFRFLIDVKNEEEKKKVISQSVIFSVLNTLLFSIIILVIGTIINYDYKIYLIFYIVASILSGLAGSILRGTSKYKKYALFNFLSSIFTVILNILFILFLKIGLDGLFLSYILANSFVSLLFLYIEKTHHYLSLKNIDKKLLKEMIKYSVPLVPNSISWVIINLSDRLIITFFLGLSVNGIYSIANKFPTIINTFYNFFYMAWKESASIIVKEKNKDEYYKEIYKDLNGFLVTFSLLLISSLPFIFPILIKGNYVEAYPYILPLIIAIYFSNLSSFYGGIFAAYKDTKIMGSSTIWGAIINIVVNLLFIKYIGIYAAVLSTFLSTFIIYIYRSIKLRKYVIINKDSNIIKNIIILIIVSMIYYSNNLLLYIISLIITSLYFIYINKSFINFILRKLKISK